MKVWSGHHTVLRHLDSPSCLLREIAGVSIAFLRRLTGGSHLLAALSDLFCDERGLQRATTRGDLELLQHRLDQRFDAVEKQARRARIEHRIGLACCMIGGAGMLTHHVRQR